MTAHARLAPSSAGRWGHCPGSILMESHFPDNGESGKEGEASHWVAAELLANGRLHNPGETAPNGVVLNTEIVQCATYYCKEVSNALHGLTPAHYAVERAVKCGMIHPDCWGTPDLSYYLAGLNELHVWDYKFGWSIVDVIGNMQLTCYAMGAWEEVLHCASSTTVVFHIVQPRPQHALGAHREWRATVDVFSPAVKQLRDAAAVASTNYPYTLAGEHCRHCKARRACPAARNTMYAGIDYTERAELHELTPEQLGAELMAIERAEQAITYMRTGLEAQALGIIANGGTVPGYMMERGQGRCTWNCPADQVFALGDLYGVDLRKDPVPVTPYQAKQLRLPAEILSAFSATPLGDPKLVRSNKTLTAQVFGSAAAARDTR